MEQNSIFVHLLTILILILYTICAESTESLFHLLKHFKYTCTNLQSAGPEKGKFCVLILERTRKIMYFTSSLLHNVKCI